MSWTFFKEFCTNWRHTGALAPSSPALARAVVDLAHVDNSKCILELGPGTGPLTEVIAERMKPNARYLGLELNQAFVERLTHRFPAMKFEAVPAQTYDFGQFLSSDEMFDSIVSGLPWTAFPHDLQVEILDHSLSRLRPGGRLVTFAYAGLHLLPAGRHFAELLASRSAQLIRSATVWGNFPPAFVYAAVRAPY